MSIIKPGTGSSKTPVKGWSFNAYRAYSGHSVSNPIFPVWCCGYTIFHNSLPVAKNNYRDGGLQWRDGDETVYDARDEAVDALLQKCDQLWAERRVQIVAEVLKGDRP